MWYKVFIALFPFAKEWFFNSKEEASFSDPKFNPNKWIRYSLSGVVVFIALYSTERMLVVSDDLNQLELKYNKQKDEITSRDKEIMRMQERIIRIETENETLKLLLSATMPKRTEGYESQRLRPKKSTKKADEY